VEQESKYIFDLDGTLYRFSLDGSVTFGDSTFYADLKTRVVRFLADSLGMADEAARTLAVELDQKFNGELGIGVEKTLGIDRYAYYEATWKCDPATYIAKDEQLSAALQEFAGCALLLTAAPKVWAQDVLDYLGVAEVFGSNVITGEPDLRKPDQQVFAQATEKLGAPPANITSIGDQNYSDILPAKQLGMKTIIIGPSLQDADYRVDDIYDALALITKRDYP